MHSLDSNSTSVPAFLIKLWKLVEDPNCDDLIAWSESGYSFFIKNQGRFSKELLPQYFKHNNMASFIRQLNMYGFKKVINYEKSGLKNENEEMEFQNGFFVKEKAELLELIKRKIPTTRAVVESSPPRSQAKDLLVDLTTIREKQESMDTILLKMKKENELLWRELTSMRQKHKAQEQIIQKVIQFLVSLVQRSNTNIGVQRKIARMLQNSSTGKNSSDTMEMVHNNSSDCIIVPESMSSPQGPVIHEVMDGEEGHNSTLVHFIPSSSHESNSTIPSDLVESLQRRISEASGSTESILGIPLEYVKTSNAIPLQDKNAVTSSKKTSGIKRLITVSQSDKSASKTVCGARVIPIKLATTQNSIISVPRVKTSINKNKNNLSHLNVSRSSHPDKEVTNATNSIGKTLMSSAVNKPSTSYGQHNIVLEDNESNPVTPENVMSMLEVVVSSPENIISFPEDNIISISEDNNSSTPESHVISIPENNVISISEENLSSILDNSVISLPETIDNVTEGSQQQGEEDILCGSFTGDAGKDNELLDDSGILSFDNLQSSDTNMCSSVLETSFDDNDLLSLSLNTPKIPLEEDVSTMFEKDKGLYLVKQEPSDQTADFQNLIKNAFTNHVLSVDERLGLTQEHISNSYDMDINNLLALFSSDEVPYNENYANSFDGSLDVKTEPSDITGSELVQFNSNVLGIETPLFEELLENNPLEPQSSSSSTGKRSKGAPSRGKRKKLK